MHQILRHARAIACLASALALVGPPLAHAQRVRTYVSGDRLPALPLSGPHDVLGPVTGSEGYYDVLRVVIGTDVTLPHEARFYGVTAIAIQEKGDEPCRIELYGRLLDPEGSQADLLVGKGTLFGCDEERNASWRAATLVAQPHNFVRSVRACFQRSPFSHLKIKGLMVASGVVYDDGRIFPLPELPCFDQKTPHCFARPNCDNWAEVSSCPADQIVTGVTVFHYAADHNPPRALSAIQPFCRNVRSGEG